MTLKMQILDADYFLNKRTPVVRLFGRTEKGNSVCAMVEDTMPYFYARASDTDSAVEKIEKMSEVSDVEKVRKKTPLGYCPEPIEMLKITLYNPRDVPAVRNVLSDDENIQDVYEADILFKYRFMIDHGLRGMQWAEIKGKKTPTQRVKIPAYRATSVRPIEKSENAPLRYLSVDIECISEDPSRPPEAKKDPIVMISLAFQPGYKNKSTLVLVAKNMSSKDTRGFSSEKEMLEELVKIIDDYDPDIITGYNINLFDMPYILERLKQNNITLNISRSDKPVYSRTFGNTQEHTISGRVLVDPYKILKRDPWTKLHRYDLNSVAKKMLGEEKHDVEYKEMQNLWNGSRADLLRFVEYARKDAVLTLKLLTEKQLADKFFELSKISGLVLQDTFGGQAKRVETMVMHEFRKRGFVMPLSPSSGEMSRRNNERAKHGLKGATVLEPEKGLHAEGCVLVLDFKSLYPSIMRTYNVSPDTVVTEDYDGEYYESPNGSRFVDAGEYEGILPDILTGLISARAEIKKEMQSQEGEKKRTLNAKQLALKDMSNSFYGYTGYVRARLYVLDVANTITAYGRKNLLKTKKLIEKKFGRKVIYADTDSAFVKTDITDLDKGKELGDDISKFVSGQLPGVLDLEFEKLYRTFLILTKKRYAGWKFEKSGDDWEDEIEMKGIETVRRDWCPLVSEVMNDILEIILKEGDLKKAMERVRKVLDEIKSGKVSLEKLTIIKGITKSLDSYEGTLPHIELGRKLAKRNPHDAPKVGDRLGFVIIKGNQMLSKRAEDPKYVRENNLHIDPDYYIQSQLLPPIERILNSVGIERTELLGSGRQARLGDIVNNRKRKMKHDIDVNYSGKSSGDKERVLGGVEDFVCSKCQKSYRRVPLNGKCGCGGKILMSYHGSMSNRAVVGNAGSDK